jgi:3-dehydroquinate synthase
MSRGEPTRLRVEGPAPYEVLVGYGLAGELGLLLGTDVESVAVICPRQLRSLGAAIRGHLTKAGYRAVPIEIPDGEAAKSAEVAEHCWSALGRGGFTRSDAVVGVGGGATTDVAGFVAGTWLRGVRLVNVPTTLLGMVDAAVGGKTGINTADGKNLVGVFHPPAGVLCDLAVLRTLPAAEWISGLAEVVKAGFIADPAILDLIAADPAGAARPDGARARELIERSIAMKADVVSRDLREAGLREILNYGHTLGHAIEQAEHYQLPHGHCVSIGMVYAAAIGRRSGRLDDATADQHRTILDQLGLPTSYQPDAFPGLLDLMQIDKKSRGSMLRLVVLDGLGKVGMLEDPDPGLLVSAYEEVAA